MSLFFHSFDVVASFSSSFQVNFPTRYFLLCVRACEPVLDLHTLLSSAAELSQKF